MKLISRNAVNQKINIATGTVSNQVGTKWCSKAEVNKLSKIGLGAANQITQMKLQIWKWNNTNNAAI